MANVRFHIDATLSGRTTSGTPKESNCYTINDNDWYYYTSLSGTLTGSNSLAGGVINISLLELSFQIGTGADLNEANDYGASAWLDYTVVSHPTASGVSFANSGAQLDFNLNLSGGSSTCPGGNSNGPGSSCALDILFVVGNTSLNSGDMLIRNRLENQGYNVMVVDDNYVQTSDANGKDLILVSSTVASYNLGNMFKHSSIPFVTWEAWLYDDMDMVSGSQYGSQDGVSQGVAVNANAGHPILGSLSGTVNIYSQSTSANWGTAAVGNDLLYIPGHPTRCLVIAYDAGEEMGDGFHAPARRAGLFLRNESAQYLTNAGWGLFDRTIQWATNCYPNQNYSIANQYLTLQAQQAQQQVNLYWANNTGQINDYFVIERSADGINFEPIGEATSYTDNSARAYEAIDYQPVIGDNYYRVMVKYLGGGTWYSPMRRVTFNDLVDFGLYPNPAQNEVHINLDHVEGLAVEIQIFDQLGRQIESIDVEEATRTPYRLNTSTYQNGSYLIYLKAEGKAPVSKPLMIMRY